MKQLAVFTHWLLPAFLVLLVFSALPAVAEIHIQDNFDGAAGAVTASPLEVDLNRQGWTVASGGTALWLSGDGKLVSPDQTADRLAAVALLPTSPFAVITLTATVEMPVGDANWIGFGLADGVHSLSADQSGPWVEVHGTGLIKLYGGSGTNSAHSQTVSYAGGPVQVVLTYNAYASTMSLTFGGSAVFTDVAVAHTPGVVSTNDAVIEFAPGAGQPTAFAVDDFSVDVIPRPRPILTLPITNTIFVHDYTGTDDRDKIQTALNAAKTLAATGKVVELRFDPITYTIATQSTEGTGANQVTTNTGFANNGDAVQITNASNVWINGNGAQILITNMSLGFLRLYQCTNCIAQNFTIDSDPLPWVEGDVVSVKAGNGTGSTNSGTNNIVIDLHSGFPDPTSASFLATSTHFGYIIDRNHLGRLRDNSNSSYSPGTVTQVAGFPARYQVALNETDANARTILPGDLWVHLARGAGPLFNPVRCTQVSLIGLTAYAGGGLNIGGQLNQLLGVVNCQVRIKAGRSKSTDADAVLMLNCRIAPWVEGCIFEGVADDLVTFTTAPYVILQTSVGGNPAAYKIGNFGNGTTSVNFGALEFSPGDQLRFFNPQDGTVFGQATVVSVDSSTSGQTPQTLVLSTAVPNVVTGASQTSTFIFNDSLNSSGVVVNNQFLNSRRWGADIKASYSLIADNTFTGLSETAINAETTLGTFVLGFIPSNLLITRNVFTEIGNDFPAITTQNVTSTPVYASISLHKAQNHGTTLGDNYVTTGREFTGIHILGNTFNSWRRAAVRLMNCNGVEVIGNTFGPPKVDTLGVVPPGNRLIDLHYSDNIVIANNVASDVPPGVATLLQTHTTNVQIAGAFGGTQLSIASNNTNPAWAKVNNTVTLTFTANTTPTVTLLGVSVTPTNPSGNTWVATATVTGGAGPPGTVNGIATFSINGIDPGATTDGSSVIVDKNVPVLTVQGSTTAPANITTEAAGPTGTAVSFTSSATDTYDPSPVVSATPASGSTFPLGTTAVNVSATDAAGNVKTLSFTVTVRDTTAPVITVLGSNPATAAVDSTYTDAGATAADIVSGSVPVTPSGTVNTTVPGSYTITYTASDAAGNSGTATRTVTVPHTPHADWRVSAFGAQASNPAVAGDLVDPNKNGLVNLLEYALGGDPLGNTTGSSVLPVSGRDTNNHETLSFTRSLSRTDLTLTVQGADTLGGAWTDLAQSVAGGSFTLLQAGGAVTESGTGDVHTMTVSDLYPMGNPGHPRRFLRLQIVR